MKLTYKSNKKVFSVILIIVFILLLIGLGFWYYTKYLSYKKEGFNNNDGDDDEDKDILLISNHDYRISELIEFALNLYDDNNYVIQELDKIKGDISGDTLQKATNKIKNIYSSISNKISQKINTVSLLKIINNETLSNNDKTEEIHNLLKSAIDGINIELKNFNDIKNICNDPNELSKL